MRFEPTTMDAAGDPIDARIVVVGDGRLASEIAARLRQLGCGEVSRDPAGEGGVSLLVCALEGAHREAILDVNARCVAESLPALFVTVEGEAVRVGPSYVPGISACFACVPDRDSAHRVVENERIDRAVALAATEAIALATGRLPLQLLTRMASVPRHSAVAPITQEPLVMAAPRDRCVCGTAVPHAAVPPRVQINADIALLNSRFDEPRLSTAFDDVPDPYRSVGVIGGGTAGYFAALALKAKLPHLDVTLVESSQIPIIGVGESTTPDVVYFLHGDLGFDLHEFYCAVRPTWKMGIKFFWGKPGDYFFNEPFARPRHAEALRYDGDLNAASVVSQLMLRERGALIDTDAGPAYLVDRLAQPKATYTQWCAYHLDNRRFVAYLAMQARRRGIPYIDAKVRGAVKTADGEEIDYLVTDQGQHLKFDLYIDCTGFRSALLEQEMGSRFVSFERSLFTDTAVVADVPHGGHLKPYTLAESMECGWCWNIPQEESDHRGYVFSSSFCSVADAVAEMREKNPYMSDYWTVKFRSGRHEEFWKGNVIGVGNAYGFVEPLESTAIQIVIIELQTLIRNFPKRRSERAAKQAISSKVAGAWDYIRWFLSIHYRFNRKFSNAFWRTCWSDTDISGIADLVALFQERAPLLSRPDADLIRTRLTSDDLTFNLALVDTMLFGQGVETAKLEPPIESPESWRRRAAAAARLLDRAIPQRRALEILRERPEILGAVKIPGII